MYVCRLAIILMVIDVHTGNAVYQNTYRDGPIYLDQVNCQGTENSILECEYNSDEIGRFISCDPSNSAGVSCNGRFLII